MLLGFYCTLGAETRCGLAALSMPSSCVVKYAKLFRAIIHWVEITGLEKSLESVIYLHMMGCLPSCLEPQASASRGREQNISGFFGVFFLRERGMDDDAVVV